MNGMWGTKPLDEEYV